jgi:predicted alpha/beta superfamily hydrolase
MKFFITLLSLTIMNAIQSQSVQLSSGSITRYENFPSKFIAPRTVDVWLPDGYSAAQKYTVLYMHDGQMLFDSTTTWNKSEWGVDETLKKLHDNNEIRDCIIVAIWNIPEKRFADYFPEKIIQHIPEPTRTEILTKQIKGIPGADNYLKFIVTELKPFIDNNYSTQNDVNNTFIIGSSMGGLISAYAVCEYPSVFGGAACLSIHSPLVAFELINDKTNEDVASKFRDYLAENLPPANTRKFYFDYGDQTGDSLYRPYQTGIDQVMKQKGYSEKYWETKFFPGENHSEKSWAKRLYIPILFLVKK